MKLLAATIVIAFVQYLVIREAYNLGQIKGIKRSRKIVKDLTYEWVVKNSRMLLGSFAPAKPFTMEELEACGCENCEKEIKARLATDKWNQTAPSSTVQ